jgi:hypothetical protein
LDSILEKLDQSHSTEDSVAFLASFFWDCITASEIPGVVFGISLFSDFPSGPADPTGGLSSPLGFISSFSSRISTSLSLPNVHSVWECHGRRFFRTV